MAFPFRPEPAPDAAATANSVTPDIPGQLAERSLLLPVRGVRPSDLYDSFYDKRGEGREHRAIDIMADLRTPVVAVESGRVARLENSALGGISIYQFDPTGQYVYYYGHLNSYASGLAEGQVLRQGDVIGYVGQSGNAQTPHLHFAVSRLGPDRKWWRGEPLNPYPLLL
ncbi:MAG: M23 family metallopeptidase, partial [Acidobacteria bacterium]